MANNPIDAAPLSSSIGTMLRPANSASIHALATITDPRLAVEARINAGLPQGAGALAVRSLELYLVRAFNSADLGSGPETVVVGEPEFLYVADVGLAARAGVLVTWANGVGAGVPTFPDFAAARLRTIIDAQSANLIFPLLAGEWIGSLQAGTDPGAAKAAIEK